MTAGFDRTADFGTFTYHGGALEVARRLAPNVSEPWIDLSTGINPHAYPLPDLGPEAWSRLPESEALTRLEAAAAQRYGVDPACTVAGPGSQALIQALSHILPHGTAGALGPTYSGFASAFAAAGARVVEARRLEEMQGSTSRSWSIPTTRTGGSRRARPSSISMSASHGAEAC